LLIFNPALAIHICITHFHFLLWQMQILPTKMLTAVEEKSKKYRQIRQIERDCEGGDREDGARDMHIVERRSSRK